MRTALILNLAFLAGSLSGQSLGEYVVQGKVKIESAVSAWDQGKMLEARAYFERVLAQGEKEWLLNYYIAYCDYRLNIHAFSDNDKKAARIYINDGLRRLKLTVHDNPEFADAFALMSALWGTKISLMPWTGFFYGPKAARAIGEALALAPDNPRVHLIRGTSYYYTPVAFGGGKEKAKNALTQASTLYASDEVGPEMPDWGHGETYGWLGLCELDLGDTASAKLHFEKALEIDPENNWVRVQLLPRVNLNEIP